jgi:hypothetical protein
MLLGGVQSGSDGIDASCGNRRALRRPVLKAFFSFGDTDIKSVGGKGAGRGNESSRNAPEGNHLSYWN